MYRLRLWLSELFYTLAGKLDPEIFDHTIGWETDPDEIWFECDNGMCDCKEAVDGD